MACDGRLAALDVPAATGYHHGLSCRFVLADANQRGSSPLNVIDSAVVAPSSTPDAILWQFGAPADAVVEAMLTGRRPEGELADDPLTAGSGSGLRCSC